MNDLEKKVNKQEEENRRLEINRKQQKDRIEDMEKQLLEKEVMEEELQGLQDDKRRWWGCWEENQLFK